MTVIPGSAASCRCSQAPSVAVQCCTRLHQRRYCRGDANKRSPTARATPFTGQGSRHVAQRCNRSGSATAYPRRNPAMP